MTVYVIGVQESFIDDWIVLHQLELLDLVRGFIFLTLKLRELNSSLTF